MYLLLNQIKEIWKKKLIDNEWNELVIKDPTPIKRISDQVQKKIEKFMSWLK